MSLNKAILMGRLTRDPELKYTPNNVAVTSFALAVNDSFNKDKVNFIDIVAWRKTAEFVSKYFHKGQLVAVEGSIQTRTYQDKEGNNRKAVEVVASSVYFTGDRRESAASGYATSNTDDFEEVTDDEDLPF